MRAHDCRIQNRLKFPGRTLAGYKVYPECVWVWHRPSPRACLLTEDGVTPEERASEFCEGAFGPFSVELGPYIQVIKELIEGALDEAPRYFLDPSNNCHWFVIPCANKKEWNEWLSLPDDDERGWTAPTFARSATIYSS